MKRILLDAFAGLEVKYYLRHFVFGVAISLFVLFASDSISSGNITIWGFIIINTFLYPYAHFVYESIANFIIGDNVFLTNAIAMIIYKCVRMLLLWSLALIIAPIGLIYLAFYYHQKRKKILTENPE